MKKIRSLLLVLAIIFSFSGCALKLYVLPNENYCLSSDAEFIELSEDAREYVKSLLNNATWYPGIAKCPATVAFKTSLGQVGYCHDSGVFNNFTLQISATISDEQRMTLNEYLGIANEDIPHFENYPYFE